jgi:hypothetical protein
MTKRRHKKRSLFIFILSLIFLFSMRTTSFSETASIAPAKTTTLVMASPETSTKTTAPEEKSPAEMAPANTKVSSEKGTIAAPYLAPIVALPTISAPVGNPGDVFLRKTASQIPVACRTYNVTLGVSGNPVAGFGNVDVVIVIDKSLSMSNKTGNINGVANIAKQLTFLINEYSGNKVGIVSFNESAIKHQLGGEYFSSSKTDWVTTINGLSSSGASNIASGITAAHELLKTSPRYNNPNVSKAVIVLSDGIASTTLADNPNDTYVESAYDAAVASAKSAAAGKIKIFGINTSANTPTTEKPQGIKTMTDIGIDGYINIQTYSNDPKTDGDLVYNAIAKSIFAAATNGIVTDTIDDRFEFDSFVSYDGVVAPTISTIGTKQVISWNIGAVDLEEKTVTYSLRAKTGVQGIVPTNESAYLTFTPATGSTEASPKYFPVPDVYVAAPLEVTLTDAFVAIGTPLTLGTGTDPSGDNYRAVTGGWYVDSAIMALYPGRFSSPVPQVLTYEWYLASDTNMVNPINSTVTPNKDTQYRVKVTDAYGCTATAIMWVRPSGSLTISKIVQDLQSKDASREFYIWVLGPNGKAWTVTLKSGESKTITGLLEGTYTISETPPMNFQLVGISSRSVTISTSSPHPSTIVTNKRVNDGWFDDEEKVVNSFTANKVFP